MKVYVVEYGAYSDHHIDTVFATRELAETYVVERARRSKDRPFIEQAEGMSFADWRAAVDPGNYGHVGFVTEYDVWDVVPIVKRDRWGDVELTRPR